MNRLSSVVFRMTARVTDTVLGPHQTAVIRIGFSLTWLLFLLREYPHRQELYGPDGPWSFGLADRLVTDNGAFTVLLWSDSHVWFEAVYALAVLWSLLLLLGWRTRTMSVLFMVGVLGPQNRSVFMGDGGDNVLHLMSVYLVFTRCGQVWSLDARRARHRSQAHARGERGPDRAGPALWSALGLLLVMATLTSRMDGDWFIPALLWTVWLAQALWWLVQRRARAGQLRLLLDVVANIVHNGALLVIMAEVCLIYATAGWYKIQGSRWQDGTAVHYPLHLEYFSPWPALADLLSANGTLVMLVTYATVGLQVAFPFTLLNRRVKNILLTCMIFEHAVIAVVLGLPFFSLTMIAADAVFLPTSFLRRLDRAAARAHQRLRPHRAGARVTGPRSPVAAPADRAPAEAPADGTPGEAAAVAPGGSCEEAPTGTREEAPAPAPGGSPGPRT